MYVVPDAENRNGGVATDEEAADGLSKGALPCC